MQVEPKNIAMGKESSSEDEQPIPPRFMWLQRGAISFGLLLVMLCVLRFWWGHEAQRRMDALARAAHARGEPFYPEDFRQAPVPDAENAAVPIEAAIKRLRGKLNNGLPNLANGDAGPPLPGELPQLESMIRQFQSEMHLVRQARGRRKAHFSQPPDGPPYYLNDYRLMSQILVMAANYEHAIGNDGEAVDYVGDAITLSDTLDRGGKSVIDLLVTEAMAQLWTDFIQSSAMGISISNGPGASATPAQVKSIIAALVDEKTLRNSPGEAARITGSEAMGYLPKTDLMADVLANKSLAPMYRLDGLQVEQYELAHAQAYLQPTYPAARTRIRYLLARRRSTIERLAHPVELAYDFSPILPVQFHFQMLTERRVSAIMLAIRLYKFDHQNELPASLSELVPAYLPAVPRDPFDPANGPLRYLPMRDPPVLYSVGLNLSDDGGSTKLYSGSAPPPWSSEDTVYPLKVHPRISPAQNHQGNK